MHIFTPQSPLTIISPFIQASDMSSFYYDSAGDNATNKFYRVQVLP
ncbi:hypothetical protein [Pedosphaera parvula]|nr:hypothetical protein [Pedosphaera parvula]